MPNVRKDVLPNGLTILTESMSSVRSVSVGIWLRTGARQERIEDNGISHFIEHMLFKGTENRSAEEIARAADSIGGHLDAFTAKETTNYSIKVLDEHLPRAFSILADLVKNPLFEPAHITNESRVIQEEIKMVEDTPDDLVHEIFTQTYWRGHALGRPILGTRRNVRSFDRQRLVSYFRRYYTPNNMLIAAAGHLRHSQIVDLVQKEFGDRPAGPAPHRGPIPVPHPHLQVRHKKDLEQVHLCVGAPSYPQPHKKRFPAYILNSVLGGGMSSRLFQNIREKRGLAYAVFSSLSSFHDAGCLSVYAGTATDKAPQVIDLVLKEFCELKSGPINQEELQRAKDYLKGSLLLSLESSTSRMGNVARQEMYFGRYISQDEIARSVDAVTAEQVQAVAQEFFHPERLAITVLGPINGLKLKRADLGC
ncbi:MAG TPA: pitrilysin family protein [Terriglobia bacterium]|nr:pitrilysin family protein [Terriglobia bacterium]